MRASLCVVATLALACGGGEGPTRVLGGAGAGGAGGAREPVPLTVVTWNAHNLFNDVLDSPDAPQEMVDPDFSAHRAAVGKVLAEIDADVVVLQEAEHAAVLESLDAEELGGRYRHRALVDGNDPRGIDIGVLSKLVLLEVVSHKDDVFTKAGTQGPTYKFSRDCLEIEVSHNGRRIVLLGVHFKAKDNDDPDKRLAEAQRTRAIADALAAASPDTLVLVLGDFNDTPGSPPYEAVAAGDYRDAAAEVARGERWTYKYFGKPELVDHQMASPALAAMLDTARILHTSEASAASDHAPLVATYAVR